MNGGFIYVKAGIKRLNEIFSLAQNYRNIQ